MKPTVVFKYYKTLETYSRIYVLQGSRNLQSYFIRCLDMSADRTKLAVVDENSLLTVYDLVANSTLYQV